MRERERERELRYQGYMCCAQVQHNGCASEERDDDDNHARLRQRWSPRGLSTPSKFLIHNSNHHPRTTKVVSAH
jgi:hypothetical protein